MSYCRGFCCFCCFFSPSLLYFLLSLSLSLSLSLPPSLPPPLLRLHISQDSRDISPGTASPRLSVCLSIAHHHVCTHTQQRPAVCVPIPILESFFFFGRGLWCCCLPSLYLRMETSKNTCVCVYGCIGKGRRRPAFFSFFDRRCRKRVCRTLLSPVLPDASVVVAAASEFGTQGKVQAVVVQGRICCL